MRTAALLVATMAWADVRGTQADSGEVPHVSSVVDALLAQSRAVRNARSVTLWETFVNDKPIRWTKATVHFDHLQRARYFAEHGDYEGEQRVLQKTDCYLYNGEITVHFKYNYQPAALASAEYTYASIYDGPRPGVKGPLSLRNPFRTANSTLLFELQNALAEMRTVHFVPLAASNDLHQIVFSRALADNSGHFEYTATVDRSRAWSVLTLTIKNHEGSALQSKSLQYPEAPVSGIWIPVRGSTAIHVGQTFEFQSPQGEKGEFRSEPREWRFQVLDVALNDPQFDEDIFRIELQPGTFVWDSRFKVDYRVGSEKVTDGELAREAAKAKAARRQDP